MSACGACLSVSWALGELGGHIEKLGRSKRPARLMTLEASQLIEFLGGNRRSELRSRLARFDEKESLECARELNVAVACRHGGDFVWPQRLLDDPEAPAVLHVLGDPQLLCQQGVAIVGARRADSYGREVARQLALEAAAAGLVVVSGLALGIDGSAHRGALAAQAGRSIAIIGGGVARVYPRSHISLHEELISKGCVVSEMPPTSSVWKWSFPARNRLIAAVSDLVVVIQAAAASGSLHTAEAAIQRGVNVAAVPGDIRNPLNEGSNRLIGDGASIICCADDLLGLLGISTTNEKQRIPEEFADLHQRIVEGKSAIPVDVDPSEAALLQIQLAKLELLGLVTRSVGGGWIAS